MAATRTKTIIQAPIDKAFAYVSDPENIPEWLVNLSAIMDVTGIGVGQHYRWTYNMLGLPFEGETTVKEHVPNERLVTESTGGIPSTFTMVFEAVDGGTKLDVETTYSIPVPVLGKLAEKVVAKRMQREAELSALNIKERLEL
ncbi:MAG: SRPBCC family protein [Polyangiales bacterium]|jgi:uncharacterized membrane protein